MKIFKKLMNVLGIIAAAILSILLIITLIMTFTLSSVEGFFEGENIHKILADVDFTTLIENEMGTIELSGGTEKEAQIIEDLMDSEMMDEVVTLCIDHIFEEIENTNNVNPITAQHISDIAYDHMDELQKIVKSNLGEEIPLTKEILDEMTESLIEEYSVKVADMIPTVEDFGLDKETLQIINNLKNGTYFMIALGGAVILTIVVMLCQVMRFKGFMWIGVDYLVSAIGSLVLAIILKSGNLVSHVMIGEMGASVLESSAEIICDGLLKGSLILAGLGIIFIIVFAVGRTVIKKKKL